MVKVRARGRGSLAINLKRMAAERRAAANVKQARQLHSLRLKRIQQTGQLQLKQKVASERALIRAIKAKRAAIRAGKFQKFSRAAKKTSRAAKQIGRFFS